MSTERREPLSLVLPQSEGKIAMTCNGVDIEPVSSPWPPTQPREREPLTFITNLREQMLESHKLLEAKALRIQELEMLHSAMGKGR
eukprot:c6189_g1_i1 orf=1-255(-)